MAAAVAPASRLDDAGGGEGGVGGADGVDAGDVGGVDATR